MNFPKPSNDRLTLKVDEWKISTGWVCHKLTDCDTILGVAKHEDFKLFEKEPINETDVDDALSRLKSNDASLTELNLNNLKVCKI